ncbi:MAG: DUF5820 family protein [Halanaeroarchaeum sp.]
MPGLEDAMPDAWAVWSQSEGGRVVLVYRPDVFDAHEYPAACLPTIYVRPRPPDRRRRRAGERHEDWFVAVHLEPEVRVRSVESRHETREAAIEAAVDVAEQFDAGDVDYRDAYQLPRDAYLDALDDLTGREA